MKKNVYKITVSAMLLALGWVLPLLTGNIQEIGKMLSPMHIPVIIGGVLLGPIYGSILGLIMPITRSFLLGTPIFYPYSLAMGLEFFVYGFLSGLLFRKLTIKNTTLKIYIVVLISLIAGRITWGFGRFIFGQFIGETFTLKMFIAGAFINAWPALFLQFTLVPLLLGILLKSSFIKRNL